MALLVLSDIHGNLEALEAVLADAGDVSGVICLGDLIGYGADPNAVTERIRALGPIACLVGNHDLAGLGQLDLRTFNPDAAKAARWTGEQLQPELRAWLLSLEPTGDVDGAALAHASPRDPVWEYMDQPGQGPPNFAAFEGPICFVGHTHVPRVFEQTEGKRFTPVHRLSHLDRLTFGSARWIVNPGGVGQPRDGDWRASYALWDRDEGTFEIHRVEYPVEQAQRKILDAGLPPILAQRLSYGR